MSVREHGRALHARCRVTPAHPACALAAARGHAAAPLVTCPCGWWPEASSQNWVMSSSYRSGACLLQGAPYHWVRRTVSRSLSLTLALSLSFRSLFLAYTLILSRSLSLFLSFSLSRRLSLSLSQVGSGPRRQYRDAVCYFCGRTGHSRIKSIWWDLRALGAVHQVEIFIFLFFILKLSELSTR